MSYRLIQGNRVYSSWSLRAWLLFGPFGIACEEEVVPIHTEAFLRFKQENFPARQVPTLVVEEHGETVVIWDSLAIVDYLHDRHPEAGHWPLDESAKATARCLCAEMHSSFKALRANMPMNLRHDYPGLARDDDTDQDTARMQALWNWARQKWGAGGPYLFGDKFTAVDAFFAPVAARFQTYNVSLDDVSRAYADSLLAHPAIQTWYADAQKEPWGFEHCEFDENGNRLAKSVKVS